ncbi:MAG: VWA domain-containing protein, partial [Deltaproteobacteria bacterium]|nr:VWA domain-containing protein [Deltaproteobacteria bacterium]
MSPVMQRRLTAQASFSRTLLRLGLLLGCFVCGVWALTQPRARGVTETVPAAEASADVMFVLDTSRSMLAEDAAPNRLARAKLAALDLMRRAKSDRLGLVAFS